MYLFSFLVIYSICFNIIYKYILYLNFNHLFYYLLVFNPIIILTKFHQFYNNCKIKRDTKSRRVFGKWLIVDQSGLFDQLILLTSLISWYWTRYYKQLVQKQFIRINKLLQPVNLPNTNISWFDHRTLYLYQNKLKLLNKLMGVTKFRHPFSFYRHPPPNEIMNLPLIFKKLQFCHSLQISYL